MFTLHNVMKLNALSCITFGTLFLAIPSKVTEFLSHDSQAPTNLLMILGAGLILNGLHIYWAARQTSPKQSLVRYFSTGDFLWVAGSAALLLTGTWITNTAGIISTLIVGAIVGLFGVLQWLKSQSI